MNDLASIGCDQLFDKLLKQVGHVLCNGDFGCLVCHFDRVQLLFKGLQHLFQDIVQVGPQLAWPRCNIAETCGQREQLPLENLDHSLFQCIFQLLCSAYHGVFKRRLLFVSLSCCASPNRNHRRAILSATSDSNCVLHAAAQIRVQHLLNFGLELFDQRHLQGLSVQQRIAVRSRNRLQVLVKHVTHVLDCVLVDAQCIEDAAGQLMQGLFK
mmetsp:Transcript_64577/g.119045  ORF Transcript_64577/g.119045 Transcript_64577/m.119045 type:complete len:212 (+) Transcript_64577:510-1145(+)